MHNGEWASASAFAHYSITRLNYSSKESSKKKWRKEGEDKEGKEEASPLGGMPADFTPEFRCHGNLILIMFCKTPICNVYRVPQNLGYNFA